ncbi:hypothetical protein P4E94_19020 [Pontiellaceae bacterium B12219]|nr:hypothetical protein [Pontiellaceae bacterium B12219]
MKYFSRIPAMLMLISAVTVHGYSNPIEGGTSQVVSSDWNVALPWLVVGSNSESNTLYVHNNGRVDSQIGILGNTASSMFNDVMVSGSNAVWNSSMEIAVGNYGSENTIAAFDGGTIETPNLYVGKYSSNNFAMAYGEGSGISVETLHVGHTGSDNTLAAMDGGRISSTNASLGHWIGSDANAALVMGTNSAWNNSGILNVGEHGSENMLMVVDGGTVQSPVVNVGVQSYSSNNTIAVFGAGSMLAAPELNIGGTAATAGGTGNRVSVSDGGTIATTDLTIHAGNNLDLNDGGTVFINNDYDVSQEGFNWNDGGHLSVSGNLSGMPIRSTTYIDWQYLDGENKTLTLDAGSWNAGANPFVVGLSGNGNRVVVTNGGAILGGSYNMVGYKQQQ